MTSFPLVYLLIPFGVIFLLAALFFFFNIFHLKRYAIKSPSTTWVITIYVVSFLGLCLIIGGYLLTVDWSRQIAPKDLIPTFRATNQL